MKKYDVAGSRFGTGRQRLEGGDMMKKEWKGDDAVADELKLVENSGEALHDQGSCAFERPRGSVYVESKAKPTKWRKVDQGSVEKVQVAHNLHMFG